ncbi:MAG: pyridoxamine 5'-phosphate oxidase [Opitutales bacterium]|nr:pyridoxamine 5'-phosphate oxidase [Opitutales bacterium]
MNLAELRQEYTRAGLRREDLDGDPVAQFRKWIDQVGEAGLPEPNAMVLATMDGQGQAFTRTVLLKNLDRRGFVFYTNFESRKARQMEENAKVSLLFPWFPLERQVSINGVASRISTAESLKYFASRPLASRLGAWASPQSTIIRSRSLLESKFQEMKAKFASGDIPLPSFWGGYRVEPETVEFWQGRQSRLHDRFIYQKTAEGWRIERLAP